MIKKGCARDKEKMKIVPDRKLSKTAKANFSDIEIMSKPLSSKKAAP